MYILLVQWVCFPGWQCSGAAGWAMWAEHQTEWGWTGEGDPSRSVQFASGSAPTYYNITWFTKDCVRLWHLNRGALKHLAVVCVSSVPQKLYSLWIGCGPLLLLLTGFRHGANSASKELHLNGSLQLSRIWTHGRQKPLQIWHTHRHTHTSQNFTKMNFLFSLLN